MIDRPQVGDIVLVFSMSLFHNFYEAEVLAIAQNDFVDFNMYQVRPIRGLFRRRRWIRSKLIYGIIARASDSNETVKLFLGKIK